MVNCKGCELERFFFAKYYTCFVPVRGDGEGMAVLVGQSKNSDIFKKKMHSSPATYS